MQNVIFKKETRAKLKGIEAQKLQIVERVKKLLVADNMKPLDFRIKDKTGFIEYYNGVWIRDISSELMHVLGQTSLHVMVKYDIEIPAHEHNSQSQIIYVKAGKIYDQESNRLYKIRESFLIQKKHNHVLNYFSDSEYLITFYPNLVEA